MTAARRCHHPRRYLDHGACAGRQADRAAAGQCGTEVWGGGDGLTGRPRDGGFNEKLGPPAGDHLQLTHRRKTGRTSRIGIFKGRHDSRNRDRVSSALPGTLWGCSLLPGKSPGPCVDRSISILPWIQPARSRTAYCVLGLRPVRVDPGTNEGMQPLAGIAVSPSDSCPVGAAGRFNRPTLARPQSSFISPEKSQASTLALCPSPSRG